jgi:hypothetical protein
VLWHPRQGSSLVVSLGSVYSSSGWNRDGFMPLLADTCVNLMFVCLRTLCARAGSSLMLTFGSLDAAQAGTVTATGCSVVCVQTLWLNMRVCVPFLLLQAALWC